MRIGIGTIQNVMGGPRVYARSLIRALSEKDRKNEYFVFSDSPLMGQACPGAQCVHIPLRSPYLRPWWDNFSVCRAIRKYSIDLYHDMKNDTPVLSPVPCIATVFDLSPLIFPETFTPLQRLYQSYQLRVALKKALKIIVPSENTRKDLVGLLGVPESDILLAGCGVGENFGVIGDRRKVAETAKKYGIEGPVILFAGTIQPRKNVAALVEAFKKLKRERGIPHKLVLAGRKGWYYKKLAPGLGSSGDIVITGVIDDADMLCIYNSAEIFVSPSAYEGFGLTLVEAMACGLPVISTNRSSIPEVVGGAGMLLEDAGSALLAEAMYKLLYDSALKNKLSAAGIERAKQYSWGRTAEKIIELYDTIESGAPGQARSRRKTQERIPGK
jgi:glycosyltransferase involved in cell wall biosynthesis